MKKSKIFLILGISLLILSVIFFFTLKKELVNPTCAPSCEFTKFIDVFRNPLDVCPSICKFNTNKENYVIYNPLYYFSFWLGIIFLILSLLFHFIKIKK
ncbi:MAG: hypothetical protein AABY10_04245 [Nanoarchaeota archaeon]